MCNYHCLYGSLLNLCVYQIVAVEGQLFEQSGTLVASKIFDEA